MSTNAEYKIIDRQEITATVHVSVPAKAVGEQIERVYQEYAREVRVPGFRKGRVPRAFLDNRFGRDLFLEEARDEMQRTFLPRALDELGLRPVTRPEVEVLSFGEAEPFEFRASFDTLPEIEVPDATGMEITVPASRPVTEEDISEALGDVQQQFGVLGEREGDTVSDQDLVHVKSGDQTWDVRAALDNPITGHLVGARVGSTVSIDETLPEGKPLKMELDVVGLRQVILPEIDDDLAKDAGYEDLAALRADIESRIAQRRDDLHRQQTEAAMLSKILESVTIPLPEAFIEEIVGEEIDRMRESMDRPDSPHSFSEYLEQEQRTEDEVRAQIRSSVETRVRQELVLGQLAKDMDIAFDDEALTEIAEQEAVELGEDPLRLVARLRAEDRWETYRQRKINDRIFDTLRETAQIKEEPA